MRIANRTKLLAALFILVSVSMAAFATEASADKLTIRLTDRMGTSQTVDVLSLPQLRYEASYKRSSGTIVGPFTYEGPSLLSVLALMGGMNDGDAVQLISDDGYRMSLTYEQVNGEVAVYDEAGQALEEYERPVMMLAVSSDNPAFAQGNIRAIYAGPKVPLTDGHTWVKGVIEIKVVPMVKEWALKLTGAVEARMDRSTFESLATCPLSPHPGSEWKTEDATYAGVPLWALVSVVDNIEPADSHYTFDKQLARAGYTVRVISADGTFVDFDSKDLIYESDIFIAFTKDKALLGDADGPLMLAGAKSPKVLKHIVAIELIGL